MMYAGNQKTNKSDYYNPFLTKLRHFDKHTELYDEIAKSDGKVIWYSTPKRPDNLKKLVECMLERNPKFRITWEKLFTMEEFKPYMEKAKNYNKMDKNQKMTQQLSSIKHF